MLYAGPRLHNAARAALGGLGARLGGRPARARRDARRGRVEIVSLAVGASQSSDGRGGKGGARASDVGGVWEDGAGGTFIVSDYAGDAPSASVTVIGSVNGVDFWTVRGYFLERAKTSLSLDFATRASGSQKRCAAPDRACRRLPHRSPASDATRREREQKKTHMAFFKRLSKA